MKIYLFLLFMSLGLKAAVCPANKTSYFCISSDQNQNKEITINNFYMIPAKIMGLYQTEINELDYPLVLKADWESPFFGAGVSLYENNYRLMILGGMTRMSRMTTDGYAAIVCHEIGHLLGGIPKQTIALSDWATAEGGADFFAASKCLPRYFRSLGITDINEIEKKVEKAGFDFLSIAAEIETDPVRKNLKRGLVNMKKVDETIINLYPSTQCRYETYRNNHQRSSCWFRE